MAPLALPFLDAVGECDEHGSKYQALIRPWRTNWPPEEGSDLHRLLEQSCPEVLTWRFCPDKPFNRPWHEWSKQAALSGKNCTSQVLPPDVSERNPTALDKYLEEERVAIDEVKYDNFQDRASSSQEIDKIITELDLREVNPAQFNYLSPYTLKDLIKPFHTRLPFMGQIRRSNIIAQAYSNVKVFDIHGQEGSFTLSSSGFQITRVPPQCGQWTDESVRQVYLPAMTTWLQNYFKCDKVVIYTYNFRCANRYRTKTEPWIDPFMRAHCDVTLNSGLRRLDLHVPNEADDIRKGRFRFIGIWRPLSTPYQDRPLAMLDHRSLRQEDLVPADIVFPHFCDEGYEILHNPHHRWFYKQGMETDEVIMFKLYDSSPQEIRFCPHSAFIDPSVPPDTPPRASIEIRALLVD
ncbi:hypothetical protein F5Y16DRAFT_103064 [Xylariaceae sp. FL0255]|nr:hypothetical protein F5Y16DRAFT_103064 [Xylariaceae sp. FL0255]